MVDKKKPVNMEMEKYKIERLKVYGKIITVLISIGIGTFGVTVINSKLQGKQLEQQALVNKAELQQAELGHLGKFLTHALEKDVNYRIRFATYFAKVTNDEDSRVRWVEYLESLNTLKANEKKHERDLKKAWDEGEEEKAAEIEIELANLREQTAPLPIADPRRFEENMVPEIDIKNKFVVEEIEGDTVVKDHATGLTWQQSGSVMMTYKKAEGYIAKLNTEKFAGYNVWRLPTVVEANTLLEKEIYISDVYADNELYINDVFDNKQKWIWTSDKDKESDSRAFAVNFGYPTDCSNNMMDLHDVRAVLFEKLIIQKGD